MRVPRLALLVLGAWGLAALAGSWFTADPDRIVLDRLFAAPAADAWLGRDDLGRDLVARVAAGARTALVVAVTVTLAAGAFGTLVGLVAGWAGGLIDLVCARAIEVVQAFPGLLLAIALAAALGPGLGNAIVALAATGWTGYARLARAQARAVRSREHVSAAVALGTPTPAILARHVAPLVAAPLLVEATFGAAGAVLGEAGLAFLGLGVQPPAASWGTMIRDGVACMLVAPHVVMVPGVALMAVVLAVNVAGDAARDALDVRLRARG